VSVRFGIGRGFVEGNMSVRTESKNGEVVAARAILADSPVAKVTTAFGSARTTAQTKSAPTTASDRSDGVVRSLAAIKAEAE
jgi:hypothetical protein